MMSGQPILCLHTCDDGGSTTLQGSPVLYLESRLGFLELFFSCISQERQISHCLISELA